jgi:hypothetical protein
LGLLGDEEYDYAAEVYPPQQVPYWAPLPPEEEEAEEVALPADEYQPRIYRRRRPFDGP